MRSEPPSSRSAALKQSGKLLAWLALICTFIGYFDVGEVIEDQLRATRNSLHRDAPSGEIVFVAIDDRSTQEVGAWPWPRNRLAALIDRAAEGGARGIFVQAPLNDAAYDDKYLKDAVERFGNVTFAARTRQGTGREGKITSGRPPQFFNSGGRWADVSLFYNYQQAVWRIPYASSLEGQPISGMAAAIADRADAPIAGDFRVDYSIDVDRIPRISAADLLRGDMPSRAVSGKAVVIALDGETAGEQVWVPGQGRMATAFAHVLGAETLLRGIPRDLGFAPALLASLLLCAVSLSAHNRRREEISLALGFALLIGAPVALEASLIFADVFAGLVAITTVSVRLVWLRLRNGGLVNVESGLPNLTALRETRNLPDQLLVAARIHNFAEIASTLSGENEKELVKQIVQRLSVGDQPMTVYQGDEGVFAWFTERNPALANHLEALHSLFRTPVSLANRPIDVALTFGIELGSGRANATRLGSALVAADEAWDQGLRWKYHDPARQEEVSWRLSLLGELDAAIDKGEVWIAYQPQYDVKLGRIVGAEALARWTHPEKGPISPAEFVSAAEQQGRIGKLTDFVLDRAVSTAAAINRRGTAFTMAVNISPRLLGDRTLLHRVQEALDRHQLAPERLTLELTETESLQNAEESLAILHALNQMGVRIAIDDYGTGLSTLDYLKKVPATEIKIDQSFVRGIKVNRSDLIMVQSTIALAHSLGRTVVAEGVEERITLDQLAELDCDVVQGYLIGRPMGVRELVQALQVRQLRDVA